MLFISHYGYALRSSSSAFVTLIGAGIVRSADNIPSTHICYASPCNSDSSRCKSWCSLHHNLVSRQGIYPLLVLLIIEHQKSVNRIDHDGVSESIRFASAHREQDPRSADTMISVVETIKIRMQKEFGDLESGLETSNESTKDVTSWWWDLELAINNCSIENLNEEWKMKTSCLFMSTLTRIRSTLYQNQPNQYLILRVFTPSENPVDWLAAGDYPRSCGLESAGIGKVDNCQYLDGMAYSLHLCQSTPVEIR